eukprot:2934399-Amphidinium_carterae.1
MIQYYTICTIEEAQEHCSMKTSAEELLSRCADVPPGSFCLRARQHAATDMTRDPHTCMLMGPQPLEGEDWKASQPSQEEWRSLMSH